jgi:hypothetical protein
MSQAGALLGNDGLSQNCLKTPSVDALGHLFLSESRFPKLLKTLKDDETRWSRWNEGARPRKSSVPRPRADGDAETAWESLASLDQRLDQLTTHGRHKSP